MAYLTDLIKTELVFPEGTYVATLANNSVKFKKEKDDDYGFSLRIISEVTFYNDSNKIYDKLKVYEDDPTTCVQILLKIYSKSIDGSETLRQTYELPVRSGNWDDDNCTVKLKPRLLHKYKCLLDNSKTKKNILGVETTQVLRFIEENAEIQFKTCRDLGRNDIGNLGWTVATMPESACEQDMQAQGWTVIKNDCALCTYDSGGRYTENAIYYADTYIETDYARKFVPGNVQPQGQGWISVPGGYAKPVTATYVGAKVERVNYYGDQIDAYEDFDLFEVVKTWAITGVDNNNGEAFSIDNGVTLEDAFNIYLNECGLTLKSDFFGINADGTAPTNKAYDYASAYLHNLLIFQASDVIRASAENNATKLELSFANFFLNLKRFNIEVVKSSSDIVIRIEHVSFRRQNKHFNLLSDYEIIKGNAKYSYSKSNTPRFERYKDKYNTNSADFDDAYIEYDALCSDDSKQNEKTHSSPHTVCNVAYLYNNTLLEEDLEKQKDTIVIASIVDGVIASSTGPISGQPVLNGPLCWGNLVANLWLWDRPQPSGKVNGVATVFESTVAIRKQEKLKAKVCLDDFFNEYNEDDLVKAQFGWSEPEDSEYDLPNEVLEIGLKF